MLIHRCGLARLHRFIVAFIVVSTLVVLTDVFAAPLRAVAHPADMYYQTHTVILTSDGIEVAWSIAPGTLLAYAVWQNADANADGDVSPAEALDWIEPRVAEYFLVTDGQPLAVEITGIDWPATLVDFELGNATVVTHLAAGWPAQSVPAPYAVALHNRFEELTSTNWFTLEAQDEIVFDTPQQQAGTLMFSSALPDAAGALKPEAGDEPRAYWDSGTPALGASSSPIKPPQSNTTSQARTRLTRIISAEQLSFKFILSALAIALGLGAIHALTPGHGKALVGAYLVGSRGTMRHAVALGGIVTLTHTGSVMAFGMLALAASRYFMPTALFPVLEMFSGLLIVGMGIMLLSRRWRGWHAVRALRQRQEQQVRIEAQQVVAAASSTLREGSRPTPPKSINIGQPGSSSAVLSERGSTSTIQINQAIPVNVYSDVLSAEQPFSLSGVNWRSLVALGVSGGLVPCPDAIAILLVAVAINRIVLGLSLIVTFSLGLALVLTIIGIAMVRSQRMLQRFNAFDRAVPVLPVASAIIVTLLGLGLTINAARGSQLFDFSEAEKDPDTLTFETDEESSAETVFFSFDTAQFLFLRPDENNNYQLYRGSVAGALAGEQPDALTAEPLGVWDFALSPDYQAIIYAAPRQEGGSDLWLVGVDGTNRPLVACPVSSCTRPVWSPDGTRVVYERMDMPSPTAPAGTTSLWWADASTGETAAVFQDSQLPGFTPSWSPNGQWLTFSTQGAGSIQLYNLADGTRQSIPSQTGNPVTWSPDGSSLLVTDVWSAPDSADYFTHIFRYDIASGELVDLTGSGAMGDTWSDWSYDGQRIAVVRRDFSSDAPAMGDQIWVMAADGSEARQLTDVPRVIHGVPVWSPDDRYLIFQRFPLAGSDSLPGIWMLMVETGELQQLAPKGNWPMWQPG